MENNNKPSFIDVRFCCKNGKRCVRINFVIRPLCVGDTNSIWPLCVGDIYFIWLLCVVSFGCFIRRLYVMNVVSKLLYTMEWRSYTMNFYILWYFLYENWYTCIWWFLHIQANMCWSAAMVFFMNVPTVW